MEKIEIGKIVSAVGLKGEVKVYNYSDGTDIYEDTPEVYVGDELTEIEGVRYHKNMVILRLSGITDRDAAEKLRGKELYVTREDLAQLPEGQYYVRDVIGMEVVEENGTSLGRVSDVLQNTAQDLFEVERPGGKKLLIPNVDQFIKCIDADSGVVTVRLIEGMLDL